MEMLIQLLTRFGDKNGWSSYVTYSALGLMVAVSLWDIFHPRINAVMMTAVLFNTTQCLTTI